MAAKSTKKRKNSRGKKKKTQEYSVLHGEIIILCVLAVCIFLMISCFGLGGIAGEICSSVIFGLFGWVGYVIPILIFGVVAFLISNKGNTHAYIKTAAAIVLVCLVAAFLELVVNSYTPGTGLMEHYRQASIRKDAGGLLGGAQVQLLCPMLGVVGAYIAIVILAVISVILITERSLLKPLSHGGKRVYEDAKIRHETAAIRAAKKREERRQTRVLRLEALQAEAEKERVQKQNEEKKESKKARRQDQKVSGVSFATTLSDGTSKRKSPEVQELIPDLPMDEKPQDIPFPFDETQGDDLPETAFVINRADDRIEAEQAEETNIWGEEPRTLDSEVNDGEQVSASPAKKKTTKQDIQEIAAETQNVEAEIKEKEEQPKPVYKIPPLRLLKRGKKGGGDSDAHLRATALKLEQTLQNFGVKVHVTNASCGPSVTRYEIQPEQGVKVSKIVGLADDIKLNLAVTDLRIEAPIPGKAAVGIEVPNSENSAVMLRDLLEAEDFQKSKSNLTVAVGKDIAGKVVIADIAKMPHLLVAGSTGSGKSVCINTLIMSMIFKSDPEDVKLIMVDPKVVELSVYNGIPHLLIPVVTDPKKAAGALNWAVAEMMKRYQMFAEYNVRDLKGFNEKILQMEPGEGVPKKMAQIVIIVDELADLMMVAPKDVEGAICRLAQLARAAGIHLILATQRPSVNVITGLIKANMPSRIAFAVSSGVDSRTIIDMNGAEKLLGKGDMLFYPTGYPKPVRVQGSFVSDKEVQQVVEYLIENNGNASYSNELEEHMNAELETENGSISIAAPGMENSSDARDQYFADAGYLIIEKEKASIGMLQRMFKIGFNRAARIMDQLADVGVVGPEEGTKPRKVLMTKEEFEQYLSENK
ncbi:FtsK/SpoIIIE family DNA translocase [Mediterraneibacter glycyrrhizinilyticus]|uniref:FtsK/SpoIIIE family DNA translocase n=1 Tax=Mediterraneibacter glycyrrhizinilyticus TaxID=342942 RepID=UPI0018A00330|nr:DNA translocase FtsK [Mediterraneibacter glycyrrhizinilyticus]